MANQEPAANGDERLSSFFASELKSATKAVGRHKILVGNELDTRRYGVMLPSLALQYILQTDVLNMESVILVDGKAKSHKSSLAFEIARWIITLGGYARLCETEGLKVSTTLVRGLIGDDLINDNSWRIFPLESIDEWRDMTTGHIELYREHFGLVTAKGKKDKGRDRVETEAGKAKRGKRPPLLPVCWIVDSLTGRSTEGNIETARKPGGNNMQGATNAKSINDWLQNTSLLYLPWVIILIRHTKEGKIGLNLGPAAANQPSTPGGKMPDFVGSYNLRLSVINKVREEDFGYNVVRFKCVKNGFGVDDLACDVRLGWAWMQTEEGVVKDETAQIPRWEWDHATAELLATLGAPGIDDICGKIVVGGTKAKPRFTCRKLGLTDVTGSEFGMAIRTDKAVLHQLQDALHIVRGKEFSADMEVPI